MKPVALAGMFIVPVLAQSALGLEQGTVEGQVRNSVTHLGIAGVEVILRTPPSLYFTATTDDAGAFRIENLKDGEYGASFEKPGFFPVRTDRPIPRLRVFEKDPVRLDGELTPGGSIRGRVLDAEGKPAAKIPVQLGAFVTSGVITNEEGTFVLDNLMPGTYTPIAKPEPGTHVQDGIRFEAVPTYFPSTLEESEAEKITVQGGVEVSGYEIRLRTTAVHRIRGVLLDPAGKPAPEVPVTLKTAAGVNEASVESNSDGRFEFPSVRPGDWVVRALAYDYVRHNNCGLSGGGSANVSKGDIDDLEIRLAPPFVLDVSADWGDAQPPANYKPNVLLTALEGQPCGGIGNVFPGRYKLTVQPLWALGFYPASVLLGGRDVMGQPVELLPGTPPLKIIYRNDGGTVRGTAEGECSIVRLIPKGKDDVSFWLAAGCRVGGAFVFNDVPPRDYYAAAFEQFDLSGPALTGTILARGVRVQVEARSVVHVDLSVLR